MTSERFYLLTNGYLMESQIMLLCRINYYVFLENQYIDLFYFSQGFTDDCDLINNKANVESFDIYPYL